MDRGSKHNLSSLACDSLRPCRLPTYAAHSGSEALTPCTAVGFIPEAKLHHFTKGKSSVQVPVSNSKSSIESEQTEMEPLSPRPSGVV